MAESPATIDLGFDPDALREKYRAERDKRLRAEGNAQYLEVVGEYAHYIEDPWVQPVSREPVTTDVDDERGEGEARRRYRTPRTSSGSASG